MSLSADNQALLASFTKLLEAQQEFETLGGPAKLDSIQAKSKPKRLDPLFSPREAERLPDSPTALPAEKLMVKETKPWRYQADKAYAHPDKINEAIRMRLGHGWELFSTSGTESYVVLFFRRRD